MSSWDYGQVSVRLRAMATIWLGLRLGSPFVLNLQLTITITIAARSQKV